MGNRGSICQPLFVGGCLVSTDGSRDGSQLTHSRRKAGAQEPALVSRIVVDRPLSVRLVEIQGALTLPEQENEDEPDQRRGGISRRAALAAMGGVGLGVAGAAILAGTGDAATAPASTGATPARPACTLAPELTDGPYYLDLDVVRRD